jgi:hypothetical protein
MGEKLRKSQVFLSDVNSLKRVSMTWQMSESQMKTMFISLFDIEGIIHLEFIPQDQTVPNLICGSTEEVT